jgi:hypothetical protein
MLREGYGRKSAIGARLTMPDSGFSDYGESELHGMKETLSDYRQVDRTKANVHEAFGC